MSPHLDIGALDNRPHSLHNSGPRTLAGEEEARMVTARLAYCFPAPAASLENGSLTRKAGTVIGEIATLSTGAPVTTW